MQCEFLACTKVFPQVRDDQASALRIGVERKSEAHAVICQLASGAPEQQNRVVHKVGELRGHESRIFTAEFCPAGEPFQVV